MAQTAIGASFNGERCDDIDNHERRVLMPQVLQRGNGDAHEFRFTERDFAAIRKRIYSYAGINLSANKIHMVYSRLARRVRACGLHSFEEYLALLDRDPREFESFTNSLTTNLTHFFREPHHFPILAQHLAELQRAGKFNSRRQTTLWCAAASTGEEAYSLAMTVVDLFGSFAAPVKILATDLDTQVLEKGARGVYPIERTDKIGPDKLKRFFLKGHGAQAGYVRVRPELQRLIEFRPLNLLDDKWRISGPFDAIFCRNVMIYFDKPTQYKVLAKFVPLLRADGLLFAGHSESFHHAQDLFETRGKTVYELAPQQRRDITTVGRR